MTFLGLVLTNFLLAGIYLVQPLADLQSQEVADVFRAHQQELSRGGTHVQDGFLFSCVLIPEGEDSPHEFDVQTAILALINTRIDKQLGVGLPTATASEQAFHSIARSCVGKSQTDLKGLVVVRNELVGDQRMIVVAVPQEQLNGIEVSRDSVLRCLQERLRAGTSNHLEAMVLLESMPKDCEESKLNSIKDSLIALLDKELGDGISATIQGRWTRKNGSQLQAGLRGWQGVLRADMGREQGGNIVLRGMQASELDRLTPEECFQLLGQFANDSSLLERVRSQLNAAGWSRTAALLNVKSVSIPVVIDKSGSLVSQVLRAKIAVTSAMTFLLLTGGDGAIDFKSQASQLCKDARVAFNKKLPNGVLDPTGPPEAAQLLQQDLEAGASYESIILFSATLLALNDPGLAYPLAKTSFIHNPVDPFAGVNLLLAARALDLRDEVKDLLPKVQAQAKLDPWGIGELKKIHSWLAGDQPVATPAPVTLTP